MHVHRQWSISRANFVVAGFLIAIGLACTSPVRDVAQRGVSAAPDSAAVLLRTELSRARGEFHGLFPPTPEPVDTTPQRILLIGDSEAGGLLYPLNDYSEENGHSLVAVFTWFSASILNFGYSQRVDDLIATHDPTLIIVVLGMNELFATDLDRRRDAARQFHEKLGDIPYLWIGPANFADDKGINMVFEETALPGRFFLSKHLPLARANDNRHPSAAGYRVWADSIAAFIDRSDQYRFKWERPASFGRRFGGRLVMANAAKDRGY